MKVRIMRGLPGSGKSYFANNVLPPMLSCTHTIHSADQYFTDVQGNYNFDPKGLPEAHRQCRSGFLASILKCDPHGFSINPEVEPPELIIVDNTNTMPTEIAFYYDLATIYTQDVEILTLSPPTSMSWDDWLEQCHEQNQHGVPMKSIKDMGRRLKNHRLPWYWKEKVVTREDGFFTLNGQRYDLTIKK